MLMISYTAAEQPNGWQVSLTAVDQGSGVAGLYYSLDGVAYQPYRASFFVPRRNLIV
jgi:hypothetical protein